LVNDVAQGEDLGLRLVIHQGQHVDGKAGLQLGLGEQAVQHHLGIGVPLQLDDDAHSVPVGLVP
ncbi:Arc-like DNA binding domain-containing protein, partial [Dysosmobacter welbionis]